jgi:hypothetical protein
MLPDFGRITVCRTVRTGAVNGATPILMLTPATPTTPGVTNDRADAPERTTIVIVWRQQLQKDIARGRLKWGPHR